MRNLGLKAFALLLAVLLYWFVNSEGNTVVVTRMVGVELQNVPANRVILSPVQAPQVQVGIRGPNSLVARLTEGPLAFRIGLPAEAPDRFVVTLEKEALGLPPYLSVLSIDPPVVEYVLDRLESREVAVSVPRLGTLRESLEVVAITPEPERVRVTGPASELDELRELDTLPIDLREFTGSATREAALRITGNRLQVSPRKVSVRVELRVVELERSFGKRPVEIRSPSGHNYMASPSTVRVQLKGPRHLVRDLQEQAVQPYVRISEADIAALPAPATEIPNVRVGIDLPAGVSAEMEPESVSLRLMAGEKEPEKAAAPAPATAKRAASAR
jgi:YbbR domain-containing protein